VNKRFQVYVFRDRRFTRGGNTVVSAAPHELVASVYGGGGLVGEEIWPQCSVAAPIFGMRKTAYLIWGFGGLEKPQNSVALSAKAVRASSLSRATACPPSLVQNRSTIAINPKSEA